MTDPLVTALRDASPDHSDGTYNDAADAERALALAAHLSAVLAAARKVASWARAEEVDPGMFAAVDELAAALSAADAAS